jgi:hypothetical protein
LKTFSELISSFVSTSTPGTKEDSRPTTALLNTFVFADASTKDKQCSDANLVVGNL